MPDPIRLYLDFASPYSYFALAPLRRLADAHGRTLELRPILLWAVFKAQGIANPIEKAARRAYFLRDVKRSADFFGAPLRLPEPLQISAHLAARLFYARTAERPQDAFALAQEIFDAFFVKGQDIAQAPTLSGLPSLAGESPETLARLIDAPEGRQRLSAAIEDAGRDGVIGAPFTILDGEGFFGADRLAQIAWRLENAAAVSSAPPGHPPAGRP